MTYLDLVLTDPLFSELAIAGLIVFGVFGAWRFYAIYLFFVFITFTDQTVMLYSMIVLMIVMSAHYLFATLSMEPKSPFKDVT